MSRLALVLALALWLPLASGCKRSGAGTPDSTNSKPSAPAADGTTGLRDGDLVFQESKSSQSEMVRALTQSRWTHMGVVFQEKSGPMVLEAVSPVKKTPLAQWIVRGQDGKYVAKRLIDAETRLRPAAIAKMRSLGASWLGRPYDLRFRWDDQSLYCSELAYKLFDRAAGLRLGKLQTAADMNLDDESVKRALRKRFAGVKFDPNEIVVTPDSIFNDPELIDVEP